jgi:hypothetical protein
MIWYERVYRERFRRHASIVPGTGMRGPSGGIDETLSLALVPRSSRQLAEAVEESIMSEIRRQIG